ncbi:hypothetical protein KJ865_16935, partial [Myxococcota bacterium]|nr:hypothetical protein [Myxococcota bacterium]
MKRFSLICMALLWTLSCGKQNKKQEEKPAGAAVAKKLSGMSKKVVAPKIPPARRPKTLLKGKMTMEEVKKGVEKFKKVVLDYPHNELKPELRPVLKKLIEAAFVMDALFLQQVSRQNSKLALDLKAQVKRDPSLSPCLEYFTIMYGPWDRTNHEVPFWGTAVKALGAGFYDERVTKELFNARVHQLEDAIKAQKDAKKKKELSSELEGLKSYYSVVELRGGKLVAVPYHVFYRKELLKASTLLREAAALSKESSLKNYLEARAKALLTDDYRESDFAWLKVEGDIEVVIGPYEVYEDR